MTAGAGQHRARKRFGQHFLHDPGVIERLLQEIAPRRGQRLVEIGPGLGALSARLLAASGALHAVEIDRDLVQRLRAHFGPQSGLTLHEADALTFDFCALAGGQRLRVVGNLPYNISTPILFHLLDQADCIEEMYFMLQKEVVQRLAARPGSKTYGRLSVMVQWRCQVEKRFDIGPGAFTPPPKVDSAVVRLRPYDEPPHPVAEETLFGELVRLAFTQRRKTLRNSLSTLLTTDAIAATGVDPRARPETLSVAEFATLANAARATP